jgi:hypothetical protein
MIGTTMDLLIFLETHLFRNLQLEFLKSKQQVFSFGQVSIEVGVHDVAAEL